MLNRTGNTDCKIQVRANGLTGLSYLQVLRFPAGVNYCTGTTYGTAERFRQILKDFEVLRASYATAAGYQNLCVHDIYRIGNCLDNVKNLHILIVRSKAGIELFHICLCAFDGSNLLHNARANRRHLRTVVRTCDGSDGVTAKCRTGHQQLIVKLLLTGCGLKREIADLKNGTVSRETGCHSRGNSGAQISSDCCSAYQHDLGFILVDHGCQRMCVRLRSVIF